MVEGSLSEPLVGLGPRSRLGAALESPTKEAIYDPDAWRASCNGAPSGSTGFGLTNGSSLGEREAEKDCPAEFLLHIHTLLSWDHWQEQSTRCSWTSGT